MDPLLSYVGGVVALVFAFRIVNTTIRFFFQYYIGSFLGMNKDLKKFGSWAIVTGCTDGIGKAYSFALAKKGLNIVLISRSQDKLEATAKEIEEKHGVQTRIIAVDFSHDSSIYKKVEEGIKGLEVGILINNVGLDQPPMLYAEFPNIENTIMNIQNVNATSCMMMTSLVLPQMVERKTGLLLNLSSLSTAMPLPGFAIYGAVKSSVDYFTRAIAVEYKDSGVVIQSVAPGYVSTKMSRQKPSILAPKPETFVRCQLRTVGLSDRTYGYPIHAIYAGIISVICNCLPDSVRYSISKNSTKKVIERYRRKANEAKKSE